MSQDQDAETVARLEALEDNFRGDTANLIRSIEALIAIDRKGVLVPHGIGGHARELLSAAAVRLAAAEAREAGLREAGETAFEFIDYATYYTPLTKRRESAFGDSVNLHGGPVSFDRLEAARAALQPGAHDADGEMK